MVSQALKPIPVNFGAPWNMFTNVTTFPTFHPVRSAFISIAPLKVPSREVADAVSHEVKPDPVNLDAPLNVLCSVTTFPTFHPVRLVFITLAP